jgi:hypothetical protein
MGKQVEQLEDHAQALDALLAEGELDPTVAELISLAFVASSTVQLVPPPELIRLMRSCYLTLEHSPFEKDVQQLLWQAEMLAKEAWVWPLAPATLARARANVEREIAAMEPSPEAREAARFLIEVLSP